MRSAQETRASLWARYDEGGLGTDELDARLRVVDRAGEDPLALERALTGPIRVTSPGRKRWLGAAVGGVAVVALIAVAVALVGDPDDDGAGGPATGGGAEPLPLPLPPPIEAEPVDCPALDDALARLEGIDGEEVATNPAPLSDPPALPEGYSVSDEVTLVPGSDPDLSLNISAGTPLPVDVVARQLAGPLAVSMRSFTYESSGAAGESGLSVVDDAFCTYDATAFEVPDRPEITGTTVTGIIPTTAFASWRLAERRFTVSVVAAGDDEASVGAAEALAGAVAALELDAARSAP